MSHSYINIFSPIFGLITNILIQAISFRLVPKYGLMKSIFLGFFSGAFCFFMAEFYIFLIVSDNKIDFIPIIAANFFTYLSLGYCYFHFINLGETARRIRILRELYDSKQGLSEKEILEKYNAEEIVERRINRLMSNGQILYTDGRYYINSPIMLLISKIIIVLKLLFLGKKVAG